MHSWSTCGSTDTDTTVRAKQLKRQQTCSPSHASACFPVLLFTPYLFYTRCSALAVCVSRGGRRDSYANGQHRSDEVYQ